MSNGTQQVLDEQVLDETFYTVNFFIGTPINFICFLYFLLECEKDSNSRIIHLWITCLDTLTCLFLLIPGVSSFYDATDGGILNTPWICNAYGIFWIINSNLSIFLIAVLSCARAIALRFPLVLIRRRVILGAMVGYTMFMFLYSTIPFWFGLEYKYYPTFRFCSWSLNDIMELDGELTENEEDLSNIIWSTTMMLRFVLPTTVVISSGIVSSLSLKPGTDGIGNTAYKREATITIICLTVACAILNAPVIMIIIIRYLPSQLRESITDSLPFRCETFLQF
eukprot:sb/3467879/